MSASGVTWAARLKQATINYESFDTAEAVP